MRRAALLCLLFCACRPASPNAGAGAGAGGGCGGAFADPLAKPIADAQLVDVTMWQAGLGVGHVQGDATLVVHDEDGDESSFDARLDGSTFGLVADVGVDVTFGAPYTFTLPPAPTTIRQVLGPYTGAHVGVDAGAGVQWENLTNTTSQVRLNITSLSFGVGITPGAYESLDVELWDDPAFTRGGCFAGNDGFCDQTCASDPDC